MTERQLSEQFKCAFPRFLSEIKGSIRKSIDKPRTGQSALDLVLETEIRGKRKTLIIEFKALGQPKYLRQAIMQLKSYAATAPNSYPVIVAPYIVDQSASIMEENGVGYFDLAGNCLLDFDDVFIRSRGNPNPNPITRELKSLFEPRASRVLRVILSPPPGPTKTPEYGETRVNIRPVRLLPPAEREWTVSGLAGESRVSLGWASAVKQKLLDFEYAKEKYRRVILTKPGELLDAWAKNYSPESNRRIGLYTMQQALYVLEDELARFFAIDFTPSGMAILGRYAFTSFSGARRIAPFVRYTSAAVYFSGPLEVIKDRLKAREVPTGANLTVLVPYDEGVYYGWRILRGARVVGPVQLYLDLITDKGRGEEAAQAVREQELKF
jgi:hypothetical protein